MIECGGRWFQGGRPIVRNEVVKVLINWNNKFISWAVGDDILASTIIPNHFCTDPICLALHMTNPGVEV